MKIGAPPHIILRPNLFIDAQHGLGNRLRAIASAASIANATGRQLCVIWEPDVHCEAHLSDLIVFPEPVLPAGGEVRQLMKERSARVYNYMEIEPGARFNEPILAEEGLSNRDVYVRSAYSLISPFGTISFEDQFLRTLRPSEAVRELVISVEHPSDVAVHIRMATGAEFDHLPYESPDNWPAERHLELIAWRRRSHVNQFVNRLDQLIADNGKLSIFVAADLPDTYSSLVERYGKCIRFLPRQLFDRSARQVQTALADMILLTAAQLFLASGWSSFSDIAQRLAKPGRRFEKSGEHF